jgi:hypothetical protein
VAALLDEDAEAVEHARESELPGVVQWLSKVAGSGSDSTTMMG